MKSVPQVFFFSTTPYNITCFRVRTDNLSRIRGTRTCVHALCRGVTLQRVSIIPVETDLSLRLCSLTGAAKRRRPTTMTAAEREEYQTSRCRENTDDGPEHRRGIVKTVTIRYIRIRVYLRNCGKRGVTGIIVCEEIRRRGFFGDFYDAL